MWIILGLGAIIFAILNVIWCIQNKETKWFGYVSLSLTLLTLCTFYTDATMRVVNEDWVGLMDTMPIISKVLWICTLASILINSMTLLKRTK